MTTSAPFHAAPPHGDTPAAPPVAPAAIHGRICRSDTTLITAVPDGLIALNIDRGQYHGLQGVGPRLWDLLATPTTVAAMVDTLLTEYEVDADTCTQEVTAFLDGLRQRGLLVDLP